MFFCVFILRYKLENTKHIAYNINVTKSAAEHKEKCDFWDIFPFFLDFGHFKK